MSASETPASWPRARDFRVLLVRPTAGRTLLGLAALLQTSRIGHHSGVRGCKPRTIQPASRHIGADRVDVDIPAAIALGASSMVVRSLSMDLASALVALGRIFSPHLGIRFLRIFFLLCRLAANLFVTRQLVRRRVITSVNTLLGVNIDQAVRLFFGSLTIFL
jgi:hypothetical protein